MAFLSAAAARCSRSLLPSSREASLIIVSRRWLSVGSRLTLAASSLRGGCCTVSHHWQRSSHSSQLGYSLSCSHQLLHLFQQQQQQRRHYTPLSEAEEEREKQRIAGLTAFERDQELRKLNREIARLEKLRGINTGELYSWSGRYKALARDYGMPLVVWYWAVWTSTAVLCYGAITVFDVDALALLAHVDAMSGWDLCSKVDPEMGKIGMALVANELLEPVRLPAVIVTVKPVMDKLYPPKY